MSKERKRSWDGELSDDNDDIKKARRVSSQSEELNLEDELLLDDGDDDDLLRSDPEEDELSLMPENDDLTSDLIEDEDKASEPKSKPKLASPSKEKPKENDISISNKTELEQKETKKRLLSEAKDDPLDSLDYDEDSDGDEKREKFSSERAKSEETPTATSNGNHKKKTNQSNNKPDKNVRSKDSNPVKSKAPPVIQYNSRGIPNPPPHYPPPGHHPYGMPVMRPAPPMMNAAGNPRKILVNPKFKNKVVNQQPPPVMMTQPPPGYNRPMVMMNQFPPGMIPPGMPPGIPPPNMGVPPPPGMMPPGAPRHPQFK